MYDREDFHRYRCRAELRSMLQASRLSLEDLRPLGRGLVLSG